MANSEKLNAKNELLDLHRDNERRTILFVSPDEDESILFDMMGKDSFPDFSIEMFDSVDDGIAKIRDELPEKVALVVSDMGVHYSQKELGKRGTELVEMMRAEGLNVPVVLTTADYRYAPDSPSEERKILERLVEKDGVEYLHKPFSFEELRQAVCRAVAKIRKRAEES